MALSYKKGLVKIMAKTHYTAQEVDKLLEETKREMLESIDSAFTVAPDSSEKPQIKFDGQGMFIKVLRTEEKGD